MNTETDLDQPLIAHLIELRSRLLRTLIVIIIVLLLLLPFANTLYYFIATPLIEKLPAGSTMIATEVASPFFAPFKLTLFCAVFFSIPYILYQVWAFIVPGLYGKEKSLILPLLLSSIVLFYTGILFAYYVVFPVLFGFLTAAPPDNIMIMTDINHYLNFILKLFFAFGLAFEIPIATFLLIKTGFVSIETLVSRRPYIIVMAFVAGMLLTPPDILSQALLAGPIWLLFESGLIISKIWGGNHALHETDEQPTEQKETNEPD